MAQVSFEKSIKRLEEIVELLESGELSLDESIKIFSEGILLSKKCHVLLDKADQKITELSIKDEKSKIDDTVN